MDFSEKNIVVAITGGIAAYKACDIIRELYRRQAKKVTCILTPHAEAFVSALTFQSLSRNPVYSETLEVDPQTGTPLHILLAQEADALLIVPATADTIAKLAHGFADNMVTTTALTFTGKPVLVAPAMNTRMWENPATRQNIQTLEALLHYTVISPISANLACGETGEGHLAEPETILQTLYQQIHPLRGLYQGKKVVVTAGGTTEKIDPVRMIANRSSGKMGLALADELHAMGADVTLITSRPPGSRAYSIVSIQTALELQEALKAHAETLDFLWMAAAVSDYRVENPSSQKVKRSESSAENKADTSVDPTMNSLEQSSSKPVGEKTLKLIENPDILAEFCAQKRPEQFVVGFAAESEQLLQNAQEKLRRKKLEAVVANDISRSDIGIDSDHNQVTVLFSTGRFPGMPPLKLERAPKYLIARRLLEVVYRVATQTG